MLPVQRDAEDADTPSLDSRQRREEGDSNGQFLFSKSCRTPDGRDQQ